MVGACMTSLRGLSAAMPAADLHGDGVLSTELWTRLLQVPAGRGPDTPPARAAGFRCGKLIC